MNTMLKGTLVIFSMIALILPLMTFTGYYSQNLISNNARPIINVYVLDHTDNHYNIAIEIQGLSESDTLYIYQIYVNGKMLSNYDPEALINGLKPDDVFPIKVTSHENTVTVLSLGNVIAGQFIELRIETSIGLLFETIVL